MGLDAIFDKTLLPLAQEFGACLFKLTLISGVYVLIRGNASESIKKVKTSTIGYVLLKTIKTYVDLIDQIAANITL